MHKILLQFLIIFVVYPLSIATFSVNQWNSEELYRSRRQLNCKNTEFKCNSGECITDDNICDGRADCEDASDETRKICGNFNCRGGFQCNYGACINQGLRCDGKRDCYDYSDEDNCNATTENQEDSECGFGKFQCNSGQCIDDFDVCDGIPNCDDATDETPEKCLSLKCPIFTYKCNYGACINQNQVCNGIKNCYDNSDEINCQGTTETPKPVTKPPVLNKNVCRLPRYPNNGKWSFLLSGNNLGPGDQVATGTVISYSCNTGFSLVPNTDFSICNNSAWSDEPSCIKTCSSMENNDVMTATCTLDGSIVSCINPVQGTRATIRCKQLYEDPNLATRPFRYCHDGSWDYPRPQCEPVCGLKSVEGQQLVIGGRNVTKAEYPWQVGLYRARDYELKCGGSILTTKVVLTAAHCFEESTDPTFYLMTAGKYYREYKHPEDEDAQYSGIKKLIIHEDYNGGEPYFGYDIAILIAETPFKITKFVLPVCLEFNSQFDLSNLLDVKGTVTGWGYTTSNDNPSDVLKALDVDYKPKPQCKLPSDFVTYYIPYVPDKLCAGLLNNNQSACRGDSGGGLVFPKGHKYYIRGIVSVAPRKKTGGCDATQLSLFTSIKYHVDFILDAIDKNKHS